MISVLQSLILCECFYMFSTPCFEGSICLTDVEFGTVVTFKVLHTCGCVFLVSSVACDFVCEMSLECAICSVLYSSFIKRLAIFYVDLL